MSPFADHTDADFEALDATLLDEVIRLAVQYSRSRDWNVTSAADARLGNEALERARRLVGFMATPYVFRRYAQDVLGYIDTELLCAANGFRPHNDAACDALAAAMREHLPGAIARARNA